MEIRQAEFFRSIKSGEDYFNTGLPEIAVVGKSNVGKSSLINLLTGNGHLARVSKQPGKTRLVNYFLINKSFYLVDLPGYGFARVSQKEKESWGQMMDEYFSHALGNLKTVLVLLDIRHDPTADDRQMFTYIETYAIPYLVGATKADKVAKSKRINECQRLRRIIPSSFAYEIIPVSSEDGYGKDKLLAALDKYLKPEES